MDPPGPGHPPAGSRQDSAGRGSRTSHPAATRRTPVEVRRDAADNPAFQLQKRAGWALAADRRAREHRQAVRIRILAVATTVLWLLTLIVLLTRA